MRDKCSNCPKESEEHSILCPWCMALYYQGQEVQGRGRKIQNFEGPPKGWVHPDSREFTLEAPR